MYDGKTQLLVANPLKRYLLNSTTLSYKFGADGSLTFYLAHDDPGPRQGIQLASCSQRNLLCYLPRLPTWR